MKIQRKHSEKKRTGFTLLEVLLVLAIIGVIAAFAVPQLLGQQRQSMVKATRIHIQQFESNCQNYAVDHDGRYFQGDSESVVAQLMQPGLDKAGKPLPTYLAEIPRDSWGQPLMYEYPATGNRVNQLVDKPAIWSLGEDGQDGTEDDVVNWSVEL